MAAWHQGAKVSKANVALGGVFTNYTAFLARQFLKCFFGFYFYTFN
jgi:hypothetical protein